MDPRSIDETELSRRQSELSVSLLLLLLLLLINPLLFLLLLLVCYGSGLIRSPDRSTIIATVSTAAAAAASTTDHQSFVSRAIADSDFSASRAATDKPKETPHAVDNSEQGALGQTARYSTVL